MRFVVGIAVLVALAGCAGGRETPSDTSTVEAPASETSATPGPAAPSVATPARDSQTTTKTRSPTRGTTTRGGVTGTKRPANPPDVRPDTPLYPTDTFGLTPRDTSVEAFLKRRPPEIRRPQNPQTTPR